MDDPSPRRREIVAVEEHFLTPDVVAATAATGGAADASRYLADVQRRLLDVGEDRVAAMDDQGVSVQVLSLNSPGLQSVQAADAVPLAVHADDAFQSIIAARPDRFAGYAALPTAAPQHAAAELERAVTQLGSPAR